MDDDMSPRSLGEGCLKFLEAHLQEVCGLFLEAWGCSGDWKHFRRDR